MGGKNVGATKTPCPKKLLNVVWDKKDAYCADRASLYGTAKHFEPNTPATAYIAKEDAFPVDKLNGTGQNTFNIPWTVKDVSTTGPLTYKLSGTLEAEVQTVETKKLLVVHRVPDKAPKTVNRNMKSPPVITFDSTQDGGLTGDATIKKDGKDWKYYDTTTSAWTVLPRKINQYKKYHYGWNAKFKLGIDKDKLKISLALQIKKAWLGKWVNFSSAAPPAGDGMKGWAYIKEDGPDWKYWDTKSKTWTVLPRPIASYTEKDIVFIKKGANFVGRDNASKKWPEAFPEPANYEQKKTDWLKCIHKVWDNKFVLEHKGCPSGASKDCCKWNVNLEAQWVNKSGDRVVYAVWEQGTLGRSDSANWYLSDTRVTTAAHETGHLLGAYDEYAPDGALDPATYKIEDDSIMGSWNTDAHPRHLDIILKQAKNKIIQWTHRKWDFEIK